jgi:hypothetical protein
MSEPASVQLPRLHRVVEGPQPVPFYGGQLGIAVALIYESAIRIFWAFGPTSRLDIPRVESPEWERMLADVGRRSAGDGGRPIPDRPLSRLLFAEDAFQLRDDVGTAYTLLRGWTTGEGIIEGDIRAKPAPPSGAKTLTVAIGRVPITITLADGYSL